MPEDWIRDEIKRLRDWRHDHAEPALLACRELPKLVESVEGRMAAIERRLTTVEEDVRAMATADEIGREVADRLQKQRGGILTRRQRWFGYGAALAAVVGAVIQIAHALGV